MATPGSLRQSAVLTRLTEDRPLVAVELRPPKAGLSRAEGMDTWIDMYHAIRRLASGETVIFLTDNAVGRSEEENLGHLAANVAGDVPASKFVPFLTCKHTLDYCLMYAARAASHGFEALTVLGGDATVGPPRCVEHAYMLRQKIRERQPSLTLGGWANPHRDAARQVDFLLAQEFEAEFYLTQVVSHHSVRDVERFVNEARRRGVSLPAVFGVFLYRSASIRTLEALRGFFPVPVEGIARDFAAGLSPEEVCARTIRALRDVGADKVYVSNLGVRRAAERYERLVDALA
jgi:5,10-methylenetetrahydrofolate reductase